MTANDFDHYQLGTQCQYLKLWCDLVYFGVYFDNIYIYLYFLKCTFPIQYIADVVVYIVKRGVWRHVHHKKIKWVPHPEIIFFNINFYHIFPFKYVHIHTSKTIFF